MEPEILMSDFMYQLPEDRIAAFPLEERDQSRLLVFKDGQMIHSRFERLVDFLPENALLFFNDTKVIPARIHFTKDTGATIEIFLLNPLHPRLIQDAMQAQEAVEWQCTIGNLKRWPDQPFLTKKAGAIVLTASLLDRELGHVRLSWSPPTLTMAEVLVATGVTPLPPYIKRAPGAADEKRYQTVYSAAEGAVAAPTAGLHFTAEGMEGLGKKGIAIDFLTLHVSAGTFQPVKVRNAVDHAMHTEQITITRANLDNLMNTDRQIVAVGTTSLRTLESIYWYGVRLKHDPDAAFFIEKTDPYQLPSGIPVREALTEVMKKMDRQKTESLTGETAILILPGYPFKTATALITNFHQPGSTLMLLVAAFAGPAWRAIYSEALNNNYRFLSYGDSSLLFRATPD